jgi:DNA invertase Pin-like site-specific DNA recombinase
MAIALSQANRFLNMNDYNADINNQVEELLNGIVVDQETLNEKIKLVREKYGIAKPTMCVFYGRVSSQKEQQRSSIITQYGIAQDFEDEYMSQGFVIKEYVFERQSATTAKKRKKFVNTIERSKQGEFDAIVVKVVDRMFRNVEDTIEIMRDLKKENVALLFYYDNLNSLDEKDRNKIIDKANAAEEYSNRLSDNVKRGRNRNIKNGKGRMPSATFGYDKPSVNDSSVAVVNKEEAVLVEELFNRYVANNESIIAITADWRARGIKSKQGKEVSTVMLHRMLRNSIYTGWIPTGKKTRESLREEWEATSKEDWHFIERPDLRIISDELFNLAQQMLDKQLKGSEHMKNVPKQRLFKSMIRCECCGKNFKKFKNGKNAEGEWVEHYICSTRKQSIRNANVVNCDNSTRIRKDELIDSLAQYFKHILNNQDDIKELVYNSVANVLNRSRDESELEDIQKNIDKAETQYKRELDLYREGLSDDIKKLKDIKKDLDSLKADLAMKKKLQDSSYDVSIVVEKLFSNIDELVSKGWNSANENCIDALKINGLFDSVLANTDGTLVFNLSCGRVLTNEKLISTFDNFNRGWNMEKYLLSKQQKQVLIKQGNTLFFIPLNEYLDYDDINECMNSIRDENTETRRRWRYSKRYKDLGKTFIDSINIVL